MSPIEIDSDTDNEIENQTAMAVDSATNYDQSTLHEPEFSMQDRMDKKCYERNLEKIINEEWRTQCTEIKEFTMKSVKFTNLYDSVFQFTVRVRLPWCP